jgi:hypothetical protein
MAIAKVGDRGTVANTTAAGATTLNVTTNTVVGNWLIARIAVDNSGSGGAAPGLTVSGSAGNAWTVLTPALQDPGAVSAGIATYICYCYIANQVTTADTISFDWGTSPAAKAIVLEEWSGIHIATPIAVAQVASVGSTSPASVSITPNAAGQLVYMALGVEGSSSDTFTGDSDTTNGNWVLLTATGAGTTTSGAAIRGQYKIVTASGAQAWGPTFTARDRAALGVVFGAEPDPTAKVGSENLNITAGSESSAIEINVDKPVSELLNISLTESVTVAKAIPVDLYPDAIVAQTGFTGAVTDIDEDPDSPDGAWAAGTTASEIRVSFPTPESDLSPGFTQKFRVRLRPPP